MGELSGQRAVITGASGGIGAAIAAALAAEGAALLLSGRDEGRLEGAARTAREAGAAAVETLTGDLQEEAALTALAERAGEAVDVLVHSIGLFRAGLLEAATMEDFDALMRVNLRVPYRLSQLVLPALRARRGQVVFVNSTSGLTARGTVAAYAASKFALKGLADALREEVNPDGVRVLSVFPGRTATPMQAEVKAFEGSPYHPERLLQPEDVAQTVVSTLTLPRTAEVTDLTVRQMQP